MFESRKSVHYWWSYISFAPECKEVTCMLRPSVTQVVVPPVVIRCVHWTLNHAKRGTADLDHPSKPCHHNVPFLPEASFVLRVLCESVCLCINHEFIRATTHHQIWTRETKYLGQCPYWPWLSGSNLTCKSNVTPLWASTRDYSPLIQVRISKFGP